MVDGEFEEKLEDFLRHEGIIDEEGNTLSHFGVPGMKWGQRRGSSSRSNPQGKNGSKNFFANPSGAKALLLGSYGAKNAYKNPRALALRQKAGKQRIASVLLAAGGTAIRIAGKSNAGVDILGAAVQGVGAGVGVASLVNGTIAAAGEAESRKG